MKLFLKITFLFLVFFLQNAAQAAQDAAETIQNTSGPSASAQVVSDTAALPTNIDTVMQRALTGDFAGEVDRVDPQSGIMRQTYVDLHLPGNGGLDISVIRSYATSLHTNPSSALKSGTGLGWRMDFGRLSIPIWARKSERDPCSMEVATQKTGQYNPIVSLPAAGHQTVAYMAAQRPEDIVMIAADHTRVLCQPDGVSVFTPSGLRYDMTHKVRSVGNEDFIACCYEYSARHWYTTRISDRNGNVIHIRYQRPDHPEIAEVSASDGRKVSFEYYESGTDRARIKSVSAGKLKTSYEYKEISVPGGKNIFHLWRAILANNEFFEYDYFPVAKPEANASEHSKLGGYQMQKMKLPSGGSIHYEYMDMPFPTRGSGTFSVLQLRLKRAAGMQDVWWSYLYNAHNPNNPDPDCKLEMDDCTRVTGPDNVTVYRFVPSQYKFYPRIILHNQNWEYGLLSGKFIRNKQEKNLRVEEYFWEKFKVSEQDIRHDDAFYIPQLKKYEIYQDGLKYGGQFSNFDQFNNPQTIEEFGYDAAKNAVISKFSNLTYHYAYDRNVWDIRKPKTVNSSDGSQIDNQYYIDGRLKSISKNGVMTEYTYDSQGNVETIVYPGKKLLHAFFEYKRGIPQREERRVYPRQAAASEADIEVRREVNDEGTIKSETNGEGHRTEYEYDGLNRMTLMVPAQGNSKSILYEQNLHTVTRGDLVEKITLDAFARVGSVEKNGIIQKFRYDPYGRKEFSSFPDTDDGETTKYDELGRVREIERSDGHKISMIYDAGAVKTINERGFETKHVYRAYGNPENTELMEIITPEASASIRLTRKPNGLLESVTQNNFTRHYKYYGNNYLESITHPEIGRVYFGRDEAGNMKSRQVDGGPEIRYEYDIHNQLEKIIYPYGMSSVNKKYTKNGKVKRVDFNNVLRQYFYDKNGNLESEKLEMDGRVFSTIYDYDGNDALSGITYPVSGRRIAYAPNALGQATQVAGFVNRVEYWPSGQVEKITYANGLSSNYGQNRRLWPDAFVTKQGENVLDSNFYQYDGVGNLDKIHGNTNLMLNRQFYYDKIDRLKDPIGSWGNGVIVYDGAGNITTQELGSHRVNYAYDEKMRLKAISGTYNANFDYDVSGNITKGRHHYFYNAAEQLACINCHDAKKIEYLYDGLNQRVAVIKNGIRTYEIYDHNGNLLVEYTPDKKWAVEHIYLHRKRVAQHGFPR